MVDIGSIDGYVYEVVDVIEAVAMGAILADMIESDVMDEAGVMGEVVLLPLALLVLVLLVLVLLVLVLLLVVLMMLK